MLKDRRSWRGRDGGDIPSSSVEPEAETDLETTSLSLELSVEALISVGDAFYEWNLVEDRLHWAAHASEVLSISSPVALSSGRAYAARVVSRKGTSRYEEIVSKGLRDRGHGVSYQIEYALKDDQGEECWVEDRGRWFGDTDGRPVRAVGLVRVITHRRKRDEELNYLASYDELTGHLNRLRLKEMLNDTLGDLRRFSRQGAYLVVALDNLSLINEAYGFDVADKLIVEVGKRLLGELRNTDVIGRCSGNKFGIVLGNCSDMQMQATADRLLSVVRDMVVEVEAGPVSATVSIGCVSLPSGADDAQLAMLRAEEALGDAKHSRRSSYSTYRHSSERERSRRGNIRLADELVSALNQRRLDLAFQPLVDSTTRETNLHECLIRLRQRDDAIVSAARFIPIAEKLGLVRLIDHRVLELAFEDLTHSAKPHLAINVSGHTITDKIWLDMFVALTKANPSAAERLVVEITETVVVEEIGDSQQFARTVREQGARVAIDDFGAGYTSFRNLKCLDIDLVKIDGSFVEGLMTKPDNRMFLKSFVDLARNFGLPTVAECVSSEEEADFLRDIGVEYLQGYILGEPVLLPPWRVGEQNVTVEAQKGDTVKVTRN